MTAKIDLPSSSSCPPPPFRELTYDVFLSFRGTDTRTNFTDHLYTALKQKGINTFRDDEELERGESIGLYLLKAIKESRYVIVVFSQNYADSSWCLNELAEVAECRRATGQTVLPVFYHVNPSEVRRQTGKHFGKAFEKHQKQYEAKPDKVKGWKNALAEVGNLSGWHLQNGSSRSEAKIIQEIVQKVFTELNKVIFTSEGLVGMDSHLNELFSYLDIGRLDDVRIIGICGMGGIGKTTIAEVVFERLKAQFEGHSFLANVKQQSTIELQKKLLLNLLNSDVNVQTTKMGKDIIKHRLSTKRVLIVLDDVDQDEQLKTLCHHTWFGPGSRIIITSRDEHLFSACRANKVYKVNALTEPEAFELFCLNAFEEDEAGEDFVKLSKEFLKYANGLPLAIKVLGSSVCGRSVEIWSSALKRLKKNPPKDIIDVLKFSFDGLEKTEKKMFLDIACFFIGENKDRVIRILGGCDDGGVKMDVQVLMDKSLVTLFGTKLWMHDLIQEMGWEVVRQEYPEEPEKHSRLWLPHEIIRVLDRNKATSAVQGIYLQCPTGDDVVHSIDNAFSNMDRLRLLKISNLKCNGNIRYLSNELQYLEWDECPLNSFPSNFKPEKLVEVHMHLSSIEQLWKGRKGWSMLRHLDLSGSPFLMSTPDFTEVPDLEKLVLQFCISLVEVHPSLGFLKKLRHLDMINCMSIESLPPFTTLESLQILKLSLCSGLKKFPEIEGDMKSLLELHLGCTSIEELPPSIERLTGLTMLDLTGCENLLHLPNTIRCLTSLKSLYLKGCSKLDDIPENLNGIKCLEKLSIGGTSTRELSFIVGMKNLQYLYCRGCKYLDSESCKGLASLSSLIELDLSYCNLMDGAILNDFSSLISLELLDLRGNCFVRLPESISQLSKLETLHLSNCRQLQLLPKKLPLSLGEVYAQDCTSLTDYPNQIKVLNSSESGVTVVNSLNSSALEVPQSSEMLANLENIWETTTLYSFVPENLGEPYQLRVTHEHAEGKQVDNFPVTKPAFLKHIAFDTTFYAVLPTDEIPEWFSTISTRNPISISIPQNLADDDKWKGFGACAIFSVMGHTALSVIEPDPDFSNYSYQITLETDVVRLEPEEFQFDGSFLPLGSSSHLLVIFFIPSRRELNQSTVVRAIFETTNPFMVVRKCGIRLVYEQDAGWYPRIVKCGGLICLNEVENGGTVLESGWHSESEKWEKYIPPLQEESTLVLRKNLQSVLPRNLEALNRYSTTYKFNLRGSPGWFHESFAHDTRSNLCRVLIKLPQNLHKSKKWMGFAIYTSLVEEVGQTMKEDNYQVNVILRSGDKSTTGAGPVLMHGRPLSEEHHQLLVIYIPRAEILEVLTTAMDLYIMIEDSPHVKVQRCGFRIVYREDMQGFADAIIQCMQREDSLEFHDKLVVEEWIQLIRLQGAHLERMTERDSRTPREKYYELHSRKYRNWDWSEPRSVSCYFEGDKIFKWRRFMPFINQGNSAEIQLPLNLFDDDNWLGFAVCCQCNISLGSTAPDSKVMFVCHLDSDVAWQGLFDHDTHLTLKTSVVDMTYFMYTPRTSLSKVWKQCKLARITMWWSGPCLAVHSCALRLLFKKDVEHLVETLTLAELP